MTILVGFETTVNFKQIKFFECQKPKAVGQLQGWVTDNGNNTVTLYDSYGYEYISRSLITMEMEYFTSISGR